MNDELPPIPGIQVAKVIHHLSENKMHVYDIEKIMFLSHMIHLGEEDEPLILEHFEAWKNGPIIPNVHYKLKSYNIHFITDLIPKDSLKFNSINKAKNIFNQFDVLKVNQLTHYRGGAWFKNYSKGSSLSPAIIPDDDIKAEYFLKQKNNFFG